ncbi:chorismate-binding protein [Paenibacillus sp. HN-1]|uniref:chorismate-binding protein n=1 Tax=Paenibacillus TaxID=44249 RepID=UPI001CAA091D|nr:MULTISPECIES: chorismate-binding protein [Paenibacillus]MBY9077383.1 chorismate-binding protein [Paenibacillus sp. CGMCC 1.18879]MBY9087509.1 chorismate-binding protein [Paenibacillus sinensis]
MSRTHDLSRDLTTNPLIKSAVTLQALDEKAFLKWHEQLVRNNLLGVNCKNYQNVFIAQTEEKSILKMGSLGFYIGFKVYINRNEIIAKLLIEDKEIDEKVIAVQCTDSYVPYEEVFEACSRMKKQIKKMLGTEYYDIPFIGGCKSITFQDRPQEIAVFYIPEIIVYGTGENYTLFSSVGKCNLPEVKPSGGDITKTPVEFSLKHYPEKEAYIQNTKMVIEKIKEKEIRKIVLSRKCVVGLHKPIDLADYTQYVFNHYFQEYYFMFEMGNSDRWVGVSPEIVIKKNERSAVTRPLAGTKKKENDKTHNELLIEEFLADSKENLEHDCAVNLMMDDLHRLPAKEVRLSRKKEIIETPYAYHLKSEIMISLDDRLNCFDLLGAIYPPATIWGYPRQICSSFIRQTEPFSRDYYTGIYGYFDLNGKADFALVIRSAVLADDEIVIYAGSGIVESADAQAEWEETKLKMNPFLNYFS